MIFYVPITRRHKIKKITAEYINKFGYAPDLIHPKSISEKIQWLKLNYDNPLITQGADKVAARELVVNRVGEEYLIPIIGIYDDPESINWADLPMKFAAKITNGCTLNVICTNKTKLNEREVKDRLGRWMSPVHNHYWQHYEWGYKKIQPQIIIENYIGDEFEQVKEYKFMYLSGVLAFIQVPVDRDPNDQFNVKVGYYDSDWNKISMSRGGHPLPDSDIEKPQLLTEMLQVSKKLAENFPLCRVDLYDVDGKIRFGELTFTPSNGLAKYNPSDWDEKLGEMITLPKPNNFTKLEWEPHNIGLKARLFGAYKRITHGS